MALSRGFLLTGKCGGTVKEIGTADNLLNLSLVSGKNEQKGAAR